MTTTREPLPVIGWREWVGLPLLGIDEIKCKVDTGARSSALHAFDVEPFTHRGRPMVRFNIHPWQRDSKKTISAEAEVIDTREVRSSSGNPVLRPVIATEIELLGQHWTIELTLATRDAMGFRMLLGREAVRGLFLVDPGRSYLGTHKWRTMTIKKRQRSATAAASGATKKRKKKKRKKLGLPSGDGPIGLS